MPLEHSVITTTSAESRFVCRLRELRGAPGTGDSCRSPIYRLESSTGSTTPRARAAGSDLGGIRDFLNVDSDDGFSSYLDYLSQSRRHEASVPAGLQGERDRHRIRDFGIHVNKTTGRVRVTGGAAPNPCHRAHGRGRADHDSGAEVPDPKPTATIYVHVHQHVERVWFTPKRLSVRVAPGAGSDICLHVRVEFDDGTVADVSESI